MRQICLRLPERASGSGDALPNAAGGLELTTRQAEAAAELLQVFACGEESAVVTFAHLAGTQARAVTQAALMAISREEAVHEELLRGLRDALPDPVHDVGLRKALIRFFGGLRYETAGEHLAGIAALDSGVCTIVSALMRRGNVMARERRAAPVFSRIHREEGGHVRLSRILARDLAGPALALEVAVRTRESLVGILALRGAAFDALEIDPDALFGRLRQPPRGLFG